MKPIVIENTKIATFLKDKDALVKEGRKISEKIEKVEAKIDVNNKKQAEITEKVEPKDLIDKGNQLKEEINRMIDELDAIGNLINKTKLDAIPEDIKKEYFALKAEKEEMEEERNKIALKVQKIKDRVIPIIQKEVKPLLGEYCDIETANVRGNKVVIQTFSHLENWKASFAKRK